MIFWNFRGENPFFWVTTSYLGDFNKTLITFDLGLLVPNGVHFWSFWFFEVIGAKILFYDIMLGRFKKMLITFDWGLLEPNGVHFWSLWFFEVLGAKILFFGHRKFFFQLFLKFSSNLLEKVKIFPVKSPSKTSILQSPKYQPNHPTTDLKKYNEYFSRYYQKTWFFSQKIVKKIAEKKADYQGKKKVAFCSKFLGKKDRLPGQKQKIRVLFKIFWKKRPITSSKKNLAFCSKFFEKKIFFKKFWFFHKRCLITTSRWHENN